jgi:hypothetical protein
MEDEREVCVWGGVNLAFSSMQDSRKVSFPVSFHCWQKEEGEG